MLGIGIDTGGTYTDAVIFDTETREVLSSGKSLTTHRDLKQGILASLGKLDQTMVKDAGYMALSTTLATNACVENKGGRAKLIFLGVDPKAVEMVQDVYGLPPLSDIYFLDCVPAREEALQKEPDWEKFRNDVKTHMQQYDSFAIVQIFPQYNGGVFEKTAEKILKEESDTICVRGYELYQELNVQKRGATALLNAKLLPVMQEFFDSIDQSLKELGLDPNIYVMKSDGSIMGKEFAMTRPVETLLCGPAASINGAIELTSVSDGMVIDMGGTTSDIGFIKDGRSVSSSAGVQVGNWKTMVKGVDIDTFALGGDSGVMMKYGELYLGERRSIPLCIAAETWPGIHDKMRGIMSNHMRYSRIGEMFLVLTRMPDKIENYTPLERRIIEALKDEPQGFQELADKTDIPAAMLGRHKQRLEDEDLIMRIGLTPTDVMHVYGDYSAFDGEISRMGIRWMARQCNRSYEAICREVYDLVEYKLYRNLVEILVKHQLGSDMDLEEMPLVEELMKENFKKKLKSRRSSYIDEEKEDASEKSDYVTMTFLPPMSIISTGAPTGIFLPAMETLFDTDGVKPEYAHVANAVGAVAGSIVSEYAVRINRYGESRFMISGADERLIYNSYRDAVETGEKIAREKALAKARKQGAEGDLNAETEIKEDFYHQQGGEDMGILIETTITASVQISVDLTEKRMKGGNKNVRL